MVSSYSGDPMKNEPTVLILCGGLRPSTRIHRALEALDGMLTKQGIRTRWFCLGDHLNGIVDGLIRALQRQEARS